MKILNVEYEKTTRTRTPNCPFNTARILPYRLCGFKIGKHPFTGMKCYLDDVRYDLLTIGNNITISYGVYCSCHGNGQRHLPIVIDDGAYIGMRANVMSQNPYNLAGKRGIHKQKSSVWCLHACHARYTGSCNRSRFPLQNNLFSGCLGKEVLAA